MNISKKQLKELVDLRARVAELEAERDTLQGELQVYRKAKKEWDLDREFLDRIYHNHLELQDLHGSWYDNVYAVLSDPKLLKILSDAQETIERSNEKIKKAAADFYKAADNVKCTNWRDRDFYLRKAREED